MSGTVWTKTITKPWSHVSNLEEHNAPFSCRITWGFSSQPLPPMARGDHVELHKKKGFELAGKYRLASHCHGKRLIKLRRLLF